MSSFRASLSAILIASILLFVCSNSFAAEDAQPTKSDWVSITTTDSTTFTASIPTLEYKTFEGVTYFQVTGRTVIMKTTNIKFYTWLINPKQCEDKQGSVLVVSRDGEFKPFLSPFVLGGGNVASDIADFLCTSHSIVQKNMKPSYRKNSIT